MQLGLVWMALSQCEHHATKHVSSTGIFLFVRNVGRGRDANKKIRSHKTVLFSLNTVNSFCTSSYTIH